MSGVRSSSRRIAHLRRNCLLLAGILGLLSPSLDLVAHPGRTDASGCHTCRRNCSRWGLATGQYHCHGQRVPRRETAPRQTAPPPQPISSTPDENLGLAEGDREKPHALVTGLSVVDGDTFVARHRDRLLLLRVHEVEAPEISQRCPRLAPNPGRREVLGDSSCRAIRGRDPGSCTRSRRCRACRAPCLGWLWLGRSRSVAGASTTRAHSSREWAGALAGLGSSSSMGSSAAQGSAIHQDRDLLQLPVDGLNPDAAIQTQVDSSRTHEGFLNRLGLSLNCQPSPDHGFAQDVVEAHG